MELDRSRRAFGCNPIEVTLETRAQAQTVLSHEAFFRVGTICRIYHSWWGYANMKLVADIKIILYSFPGERIVILEAYRRRRLHLRHFLTDVKKQNPDVEFCLNEDKLVIDGRDVSYCEQTNAVCIQTQNDAPSRWTRLIEEHCVKIMNVIFFSSFSLLDTYRWRNQWRKLRSN